MGWYTTYYVKVLLSNRCEWTSDQIRDKVDKFTIDPSYDSSAQTSRGQSAECRLEDGKCYEYGELKFTGLTLEDENRVAEFETEVKYGPSEAIESYAKEMIDVFGTENIKQVIGCCGGADIGYALMQGFSGENLGWTTFFTTDQTILQPHINRFNRLFAFCRDNDIKQFIYNDAGQLSYVVGKELSSQYAESYPRSLQFTTSSISFNFKPEPEPNYDYGEELNENSELG